MIKIRYLISTFLLLSFLSASLIEETEIIVSAPAKFSDCRPYFELNVIDRQPQQIWWQISKDPHFADVCPCLEGIECFTNQIELSEFANEHLEPNMVYYFRVCADFGVWSPLCFFQAGKHATTQAKEYTYNPHVPQNVWEQLKPFFLPIDHPVRKKLDKIFKSKRVTLSQKTLAAAGFKNVKERSPYNVILGHHPDLKGYLLKIYLDSQAPICEWQNFKNRILGANAIRGCLQKHDFQEFRVPKKWIYPLPAEPSPPSEYHRKNFILVVEDMNILKFESNRKAFEGAMTSSILDHLYVVLNEEGLIDSVFPSNIPFTKTGQIAFIDTEHYHKHPVPFHRLLRFLSPDMGQHWQKLIDQQGPAVK